VGLDPEFCYAHWGASVKPHGGNAQYVQLAFENQETRVTWNHPVLLASVRHRHRVQRFPYPVVYRDQRSARYREEGLSPLEYRHRA
jgi:hypothetical protein